MAGLGCPLDFPHDIGAVAIGKREVHEHQRRQRIRGEPRQRFLAGSGLRDRDADVLEHRGQQLAAVHVIVDDQHHRAAE